MTSTAASQPSTFRYVPAANQGLVLALVFIIAAGFTLAGHFIASSYASFMGFAILLPIVIVAGLSVPALALALILVSLYLQNSFIAAVGLIISSPGSFSILSATSLIITSVVALIGGWFWLTLRNHLHTGNKAVLFSAAALMAVTILYTIYGLIQITPLSVFTYTRIYLIGPLALIVGVSIGLRMHQDTWSNMFRMIGLILICWSLLELFATYPLYDAFNIMEFLNFKFSHRTGDTEHIFLSVQDAIEYENRTFLNLSGGLGPWFEIMRLKGPNIHCISFAYALTFTALVCFIRRYNLVAAALCVCMVLIGAKGPLVLLFMTLSLYAAHQIMRARIALVYMLTLSVLAYIALGLLYGFYTRDYHIIGFMGGVKGFFQNPLGHGIGVGGNNSHLAAQATDFQFFQNHGATFALESAVGVMLYQMGIGSLAFFVFMRKVWLQLWDVAAKQVIDRRVIVLPIALTYLTANCIFQEEALSPSGWGTFLLICGLFLAKAWRNKPAAQE